MKKYLENFFWLDMITGMWITWPVLILGYIIWQIWTYIPHEVLLTVGKGWLLLLGFQIFTWMIGLVWNASHTNHAKQKPVLPAANEEE